MREPSVLLLLLDRCVGGIADKPLRNESLQVQVSLHLTHLTVSRRTLRITFLQLPSLFAKIAHKEGVVPELTLALLFANASAL